MSSSAAAVPPPPAKKLKVDDDGDGDPAAAKKKEDDDEKTRYLNTSGVPYSTDGVFSLGRDYEQVERPEKLHELSGTYDIIFYSSDWDGRGSDKDDEAIARTAKGCVSLSVQTVVDDDKPALHGKFEIAASETDCLGAHLKGEFVEDVLGGDRCFQLFLPRQIPEGKTIWDGLKELSKIDIEDEEEMDDFYETWECRHQGILGRVKETKTAKLQADKLPGLTYQPDDIAKEIQPSPPPEFTFEKGDLLIQFEEAGGALDEGEPSKVIYFRKQQPKMKEES